MFHKIKSVITLPNYVLLITFENNKTKYYDIKRIWEKWEDFKMLINIDGLFDQVKVDVGGYGISWNDDLDLSCEELWINGKEEE